MGRTPKVLMSAYACGPGVGSEPGIGWDFVFQAARSSDLTVITRAKNREAIEKARNKPSFKDIRWLYYDLPAWSRFWKRGARGVQLYYYLWQLGIYSLAKRLADESPYQLVHHVTFGKYWAPSLLALLDAPFIWGPLGGGESAPPGLRDRFGLRGRLYEAARDTARSIEHLDPLVRLTARRSTLALATTDQTAASLKKLGCRSVRLYSPIALQPEEADLLQGSRTTNRSSFRIISCGRLIHWKGFDLGIEAFVRVQKELPNSEYVIIGDGPERGDLERLAARLGIASKVRFRGAVPQETVFAEFKEGDLLLHPSLHDSSGWVCVEAMAAGCPVVCLDWGGPGVLVGDGTGLKVSAGGREQTIDGLAEAILQLARNTTERNAMGTAAQNRVRAQFLSERKAETLADLYAEVLGGEWRPNSRFLKSFWKDEAEPLPKAQSSMDSELESHTDSHSR
jgi:glycosyltransferase involved in cell wall biosynthesis